MKNMRIRLKLAVSFSIIIVLLAAVGFTGAMGLSSLSKADINLYQYNVTALNMLGAIRENYAQQRAYYRNLVLYEPATEYYKSSVIEMKNLETEMEGYIATYASVIVNQAERDFYNAFLEDYNGGFKSFKEELTELGGKGLRQEAMELLSGDDILHLSNAINDSLDECYRFNVAHAKETVDGNTALAERVTMLLLAVIAAACAIGIFFTVYISKIISVPLIHMSSYLEKVRVTGDMTFAEEDKDTLPKDMESRDEIGRCVAACASLINRVMDVNEKLTRLADGDLTAEMEVLSERDSIGLAFNNMIEKLNVMFGEILGASGRITSGSQQISQGAQELAAGSMQQSASIEEFSSSLLELQSKTRHNAENTVNAAKVNENMGEMVRESVSSMAKMLEAMKGIDESSRNITRVIKVIDDIAFQTNILALNAAVEAARAGQHGKGFAVVADEVRNLAAKSAEAAKETADLIDGSSEKVKEGNQIVMKTNASLEAVAEGSKEVVRLIGEVSAASEEQARSIQEINREIEQISSVVQENSSSAEQSAAASAEMSSQAKTLNGIVSKFRLKKSSNPIKGGIS